MSWQGLDRAASWAARQTTRTMLLLLVLLVVLGPTAALVAGQHEMGGTMPGAHEAGHGVATPFGKLMESAMTVMDDGMRQAPMTGDPDHDFAAMIAVSAMACQFTLLRIAVPRSPSTGAMTGNLTNTVLSLLDTLSRSQPLMEGANGRLKKTVKLVLGFFAGCIVGAAAVSLLGDWAWSLPVVLAAAAVAVR